MEKIINALSELVTEHLKLQIKERYKKEFLYHDLRRKSSRTLLSLQKLANLN